MTLIGFFLARRSLNLIPYAQADHIVAGTSIEGGNLHLESRVGWFVDETPFTGVKPYRQAYTLEDTIVVEEVNKNGFYSGNCGHTGGPLFLRPLV